jgi:hypothetical protein
MMRRIQPYHNTLHDIGARRRRSGDGPEGGALAGPSASPHLPVVGVGNPVAVLGVTRYGAKRADSSIRRINNCRESHVHRAFEKIFYVQYRHQDLPLGPSDMFFAV